MDYVENYVRKLTKREKEEVSTLSEWIEAVRSLFQIGIPKLKRSMSTLTTSVFKDPEIVETLSTFHNIFYFLQIKAITTLFFSGKKHRIIFLKIYLGLCRSQGNPTSSIWARTKSHLRRIQRIWPLRMLDRKWRDRKWRDFSPYFFSRTSPPYFSRTFFPYYSPVFPPPVFFPLLFFLVVAQNVCWGVLYDVRVL